MWPTVRLSLQMRREAYEYAAAVAATPTLRTTRNYTSLEVAGRYRIGYLGEAAVGEWLRLAGVRSEWSPRRDGHADVRDLCVYHHGSPYSCEIKTASQAHHRYLMQPVAQEQHRGDRGVIIAVRLNEPAGLAELPGYVTDRRFRRAPVAEPPSRGVLVPTRLLRLDELTPLAKLVERLDRLTP